jgi:hypothetical protein
MASKAEIEKQIADLTASLDTADTDDEVWVKEGGTEFKVSGRRATAFLDKFAHLWETPTADADKDKDADKDADKDKKPAGGYFGRGK